MGARRVLNQAPLQANITVVTCAMFFFAIFTCAETT
jgi:hypothetical protein